MYLFKLKHLLLVFAYCSCDLFTLSFSRRDREICLVTICIGFDNVKVNNKSKYYGIISVLFSILYENSVMGCFVGKTVSRSLASNFKAQTEAKLQIQEGTLEHSKQ